jgi:hypothetical protein
MIKSTIDLEDLVCTLNNHGCPNKTGCIALNWDNKLCLQYCKECQLELSIDWVIDHVIIGNLKRIGFLKTIYAFLRKIIMVKRSKNE